MQPGLVRINGLFRHGWLIAPGLVETALETAFGITLDATFNSPCAHPAGTLQETLA